MSGSPITPEMSASIDRYNDMIQRANARIKQLEDAGFIVTAHECNYGVTITKRRGGKTWPGSYESMTTSEIIVPRDKGD